MQKYNHNPRLQTAWTHLLTSRKGVTHGCQWDLYSSPSGEKGWFSRPQFFPLNISPKGDKESGKMSLRILFNISLAEIFYCTMIYQSTQALSSFINIKEINLKCCHN